MLLKKITLYSLLPLALVACAKHVPDPQLVAEPDPVVLRLAEAADRAATSLNTLAAVEQNRTATDLPPLAASAPAELRRSITVDWVGPIEPIVKRLADRASYSFMVSGKKPEVPIITNINVRSEPVVEVLRDIGLQMNDRGTLKVDANRKVIEINYAYVSEDE